MSRQIQGGGDSSKTQSTVGPLKWMAPESLSKWKISSLFSIYIFADFNLTKIIVKHILKKPMFGPSELR